MCEFISDLEGALSSLIGTTIISFNKCSRNHTVGDYIIHCDETSVNNVLLELKSLLSTDISSLLSQCFYNEYRPFASLKLNRCSVFKFGIAKLLLSTSLDEFKVLKLRYKIASCKSSNSLSYLRMKYLSEILNNTVSKTSQLVDSEPVCNLHLSSRQCCSDAEAKLILVGPVRSNSPELDSDLYLKLRRDEIEAMCSHKLDTNPELNCLDELVKMSVTYDMLHKNIHKELAINTDIVDNEIVLRPSCRGAQFIMYNCVRLSILCHKFDRRVETGFYPGLPDISDVDFSLLKCEEEWSLMFDYILAWPVTLSKALKGLEQGRPKMHHIITFLSHLATTFSHYYHRTRILVDARAHLLPTIHARIYLLKTLLKIYLNALDILMIRPPTVM